MEESRKASFDIIKLVVNPVTYIIGPYLIHCSQMFPDRKKVSGAWALDEKLEIAGVIVTIWSLGLYRSTKMTPSFKVRHRRLASEHLEASDLQRLIP